MVFRNFLIVCFGLLVTLFSSEARALPFNDDMVDSQIKTGQIMRQKPAGTVAVGMAEEILGSKEEAATLENPVASNKPSIGRGKRLFAANCKACHGNPIKNGVHQPGVAGAMIGSPNLADPTFATRTDGQMFSVVHFGNIIMPAVGWKLSHNETWDIINYIRSLQ